MFKNWEWLKDSDSHWNFGRFVAWQLFLMNTLGLIIFAVAKNGFQDFTSFWSAIVGCSGFFTGIAIYAVEIIFREKAKIKFHIGDKTYGIENDGK